MDKKTVKTLPWRFRLAAAAMLLLGAGIAFMADHSSTNSGSNTSASVAITGRENKGQSAIIDAQAVKPIVERKHKESAIVNTSRKQAVNSNEEYKIKPEPVVTRQEMPMVSVDTGGVLKPVEGRVPAGIAKVTLVLPTIHINELTQWEAQSGGIDRTPAEKKPLASVKMRTVTLNEIAGENEDWQQKYNSKPRYGALPFLGLQQGMQNDQGYTAPSNPLTIKINLKN